MTSPAAPLSLGHGNDIQCSLSYLWSNHKKSRMDEAMSNISTQSLHDVLEVSLRNDMHNISNISLHSVGTSGAAYGSFSDYNQIREVTEGNENPRFCRKYVNAAIGQPKSDGISIALDGK